MYQMIYELDYRKSRCLQNTSGIPSEFKDVLIKIPYTTQRSSSKFLLKLADQLIKAGNAIKNTQVKLNQQENYQ